MNAVMSKIYLEIFNPEQKRVFTRLRDFREDGYLAGGTALALQLGHRVSVDFDVFSHQPLSRLLRSKITKHFSIKQVHLNTAEQYTFTTNDNTEITFVWFDHRLIEPLIPTVSISLASVADIAANKANTLGLRAVWRDYVDLYWLMREEKVALGDIIAWAQKKYPKEFVDVQFLEQLTYFDDLTVTPIEFIKKPYPDDEIKSYLQTTVKAYLRQRAVL